MNEKLRKEGYKLLMELAKDPDYLISLAKIGAKAREQAPTPQFYKGQPVLVSNESGQWKQGHFNGYMKTPEGVVGYQPYIVYTDGRCRWHNCKPDPDAVSQPNWVENDHTEKRVEGDFIAWEFADGRLGFTTGFVCLSTDVVRYCITPLPEWLS